MKTLTIFLLASLNLTLLSSMKANSQAVNGISVPANIASAHAAITKTAIHKEVAWATDSSQLKKRIFGFSFFSPLNKHLAFTYEQVVANQISFSGELGIIGIGLNQDDRSPSGIFLKAGPKLYFSPDYMTSGMYRFNDMQGGYFKPEIILDFYGAIESSIGGYDTNGNSITSSNGRESYMAFAFLLNFGKQWVFANAVSVDFHFGIGYGGGGSDDGNQYSHVGGNSASPFAASGGISIGFLSK